MSTDSLPNFDTLWNYREPESTEVAFTELLDQTKDAPLSYHAELLTQIARTRGLQQRYEDAHATLDEAYNMVDLKEYPKVSVRYHLERGRVFNSSKEVEKAKVMFEQAYEIALDANLDYYAVDAAHMIAIVEKGEDALRWNLVAIELAENSKVERAKKWLGSLYNNVGWSYFDMKQYEEAVEIFEKTHAYYLEIENVFYQNVARWSKAKCLRMLGRVDDALSILHELEAADKEGDSGYTYEELGECYLLFKDKEKYNSYFAKAHELLSKDIWLQQNEPDRLARMLELSK